MYKTFTRTWWRYERGIRVPNIGASDYTVDEYETEKEAQAACREWNKENDPGPLSLKMEYEEV